MRDYVAGQLGYLETHDADHCARYFGRPEAWIERRDWGREEAAAALRALASVLGRGGWRAGVGAAAAFAREAARLTAAAWIGPRWQVLRASAGVASAGLRYAWHCFTPDARYRAYTDLWHWTARLAGARQFASRPVASPRPVVPATGVPIDASECYRSFGFHDVEWWESRAFRWSGPSPGPARSRQHCYG